MNKLLVSLVAVLASIGTTVASTCTDGTCKSKKVRVIHITAGDPKDLTGDEVFSTTVLNSDSSSDGATETVETYSGTESLPAEIVESYAEPEPLVIGSAPYRTYARSGKWYVGGHVGLNLLSWKNKYSGTPDNYKFDNSANHDNYSFEPVFGGDIFAGYRFASNWRVDAEFGYLTQFSDTDNGWTFKIQTPYALANMAYQFDGGVYLGAGFGLAFPRATLDNEWLVHGTVADTKLSFMGALMAGFSYNLTDSVALDFRYRLSGFMGPELKRNLLAGNPIHDDNDVTLESVRVKTGFIMDNSLSIGLRYEF